MKQFNTTKSFSELLRSRHFLTPCFAVIINTILNLNVDFTARIFRFKQPPFRAKNQVHPIWTPGRGDDLAQVSVLDGCKIVLDQKQLQISDRTYRLSALKSQPNVVFTLEIAVLRHRACFSMSVARIVSRKTISSTSAAQLVKQ